MIKGKLASGGDSVLVRGNYTDEVYVTPQFRLFLCVNDLPQITPADATEGLHKFPMPYQFVSRDVLEGT